MEQVVSATTAVQANNFYKTKQIGSKENHSKG